MISPPRGRSLDVGLERGRVHRDEHVGPVAGGQDVVVGDLDLERRRRRAACPAARGSRPGKFGWVARSLPNKRGLGGEPVAGELHAVAGVAGEADDDLFQTFTGGSVVRGPIKRICPGSAAVRIHVFASHLLTGPTHRRRSRLRAAGGITGLTRLYETGSTNYCTGSRARSTFLAARTYRYLRQNAKSARATGEYARKLWFWSLRWTARCRLPWT